MNHDIKYKGKVYHVQTEDSGTGHPVISTVLFFGGTILGSKKTDYADIVKSDKLDKVVRELMEEQHRAVVRELLEGRFDKGGRAAEAKPAPAATEAKPVPTVVETKPAQVAEKPVEKPAESQSIEEIILEHLSLDD